MKLYDFVDYDRDDENLKHYRCKRAVKWRKEKLRRDPEYREVLRKRNRKKYQDSKEAHKFELTEERKEELKRMAKQ